MNGFSMKTCFRIALFLGITGVCYWLGWSRATMTPSPMVAEQKNASASSKSQKTSGHYFTTLEEIRALFADPNRTWEDKMNYFMEGLMPGINPADLPDAIKLIANLHVPASETGDRSVVLRDLFDAFAKANPLETLSLIKNYPNLENRKGIIGEALGILAATDPQQAFDLLAKLAPGDFDARTTYSLLFDAWASVHPADAAAAALSLPLGFNRTMAIGAVADEWARTDAKGAIQWAQSLGSTEVGRLNQSLLDYVIQTAIRASSMNGTLDPQVATTELNLITNLSERNSVISTLAQTLGTGLNGNRVAAMDWLNQNATGLTYDKAVNQIFSNFNNPATLPAALNEVTDPGARAGAISALATRWADINANDALAWAQSLPESDGAARTGALNTILTTLANTDPATAAAFLKNVPDPGDFSSTVSAIVQRLASTDPQAALEMANTLPDDATKGKAINSVLVKMAATDFASAWNYAGSLPDGTIRDTAIVGLVSENAAQNPAQAASLLDQIPPGTAQTSAVDALAKTWLKQDPQAFTNWLTGMPTGSERDEAIGQMVSSTQTAKNPAAVLAWANTISDPQIQAKQIESVLTTWMKSDSIAALNAAQTVNLPDAQKTALIQKLTQGK